MAILGLTPLAGRRPTPALNRLGVDLRAEVPFDRNWLATLYATTRDDIAATSWPAALRDRFASEQFRLQDAHYRAHHPDADRLVVLVTGERAGRLLVDRARAPWRLVDVALDPLYRSRGIGAALVRWLQREGRGNGIDLHVLHGNVAAARFYARLGFVTAKSGAASHSRMEWAGR